MSEDMRSEWCGILAWFYLDGPVGLYPVERAFYCSRKCLDNQGHIAEYAQPVIRADEFEAWRASPSPETGTAAAPQGEHAPNEVLEMFEFKDGVRLAWITWSTGSGERRCTGVREYCQCHINSATCRIHAVHAAGPAPEPVKPPATPFPVCIECIGSGTIGGLGWVKTCQGCGGTGRTPAAEPGKPATCTCRDFDNCDECLNAMQSRRATPEKGWTR